MFACSVAMPARAERRGSPYAASRDRDGRALTMRRAFAILRLHNSEDDG
jgi:hypothetical protein